ncbi:MAG: hypothetical protein AB7E37_08150 [Candidatus Altimarinota bacterium]
MPENETEEGTQTEVTADQCYNKLFEIVQWLKILDEKISSISTKIG